jgi:simple sugar transport system permease protein
MDMDAVLSFLGAALRLSTPLIYACLAGLWSERAGVIDVGLEGKMLAGAFAGAAVAALTGDAWLGLAAAVAASMALAAIQAFAEIESGGDQIVCGMAVNMIGAGVTAFVGAALFAEGGRTPALPREARVLPFAGGLDGLTIGAFVAVALTAFVLQRTRFGLRLRAAGENPLALDAAGGSVRATRHAAVAICGLLCGLSGADLSLAQAAGFLPAMTAGKGFIALAALVFAKWRPVAALATCLLFGGLDAMAIRMQGSSLPWLGAVPTQAFQALPYLMTVVLLAGLVGGARPPAAAGRPYRRE